MVSPPTFLHLVAVTNILPLGGDSLGFSGSGDPLAPSCMVVPQHCMHIASDNPASICLVSMGNDLRATLSSSRVAQLGTHPASSLAGLIPAPTALDPQLG